MAGRPAGGKVGKVTHGQASWIDYAVASQPASGRSGCDGRSHSECTNRFQRNRCRQQRLPDRQEIAEHQRFERYLFDAMDANEDDRVFASEMQAYVKEYTEPATTTCQVTIFSLGFGVFPMLDGNQDGRISVRELRQLEQALVARSDSSQTIDGSRLGNSYRIEFQRGGVGLFGRVDRPQAQNNNLPTMTTLSGPIWFQRMDRNGDSDLTWEEFLGPRQVFHELDSDGDHLVDAQEASAYQNKLTSP